MSDKHLLVDPHQIDEFAWWYEEPKGISILIEVRKPNGEHLSTEQRTLAWRSVEAALRRKKKR